MAEIKGYRILTGAEIDQINEAKKYGDKIGNFIDGLEAAPDWAVDKRWLAIARTDLQKGIMSLVRAIAKPEGF